MKSFRYRVYGITINSEIELPELQEDSKFPPTAWIKVGFVPSHLTNILGGGVLYEASSNDFLLKIDEIAFYRIQDGNNITVQPSSKSTSDEVRLFLLGSAMGALLHQRGFLPIHGSTVAKGVYGVTITGNSAVGKSSLAAGLVKLGYSLIADDISVIDFSKSKHLSVHLGIPHLKLWKDVLVHLNYNNNFTRVRPQLEKFRVPQNAEEYSDSLELNKVILLSTKNTPGFQHNEIFGSEKFNYLRDHTYRMQFVEKMNQLSNHFLNISRLANSIRLYRVERPSSSLQIMKLAEYIDSQVINQ